MHELANSRAVPLSKQEHFGRKAISSNSARLITACCSLEFLCCRWRHCFLQIILQGFILLRLVFYKPFWRIDLPVVFPFLPLYFHSFQGLRLIKNILDHLRSSSRHSLHTCSSFSAGEECFPTPCDAPALLPSSCLLLYLSPTFPILPNMVHNLRSATLACKPPPAGRCNLPHFPFAQ